MKTKIDIFIDLVISVVISFFIVLCFYLYFPVSIFDDFNLGSTITTIQGSDTLKDSRAVINTNFSNLNTDKLQSGSTAATLTVTALSTNGITQSTTATSTYAGGISLVGLSSTKGINIITGTSTFANGISMTGGCLFVNGTCLNALDLTKSNNWSAASSTFSNSFQSGSTTIETLLVNNITNAPVLDKIMATTTDTGIVNHIASSTILTFSVPGNTLGTDNAVKGTIRVSEMTVNGATGFYLQMIYGGTSMYLGTTTTSGGFERGTGEFDFSIYGKGATNSQEMDLTSDIVATNQLKPGYSIWRQATTTTSAIDSTIPQTLSIVARFIDSSATNKLTVTDAIVFSVK
jgi:hypothetical protein